MYNIKTKGGGKGLGNKKPRLQCRRGLLTIKYYYPYFFLGAFSFLGASFLGLVFIASLTAS